VPTSASTAFEELSDVDLACLYRALLVYLGSKESVALFSGTGRDAGASGGPLADHRTCEQNVLFRLGREAQREIDRRGREGFQDVLRNVRDWPFETWDRFLRAVGDGRATTSPSA
jgi:hypothetical protein